VRTRLADLPLGRAARVVPEGAEVQPDSRDAAVLLPLFEEDGEARVVLTKRPDTMPSHRGEVAFPGGKHEPGVDADLRATALREAQEEIGLDPAMVEVVARLDALATVASRFVITPFVGFLTGRPRLAPDPREVVSVFDVALSTLMVDGVHREERWDTWVADLDVHFFELPDETVWGATARILTGFLAHVVQG
jgi:8-oxo-dGTP pyrophosphatase MutT (NUDIX family)